MLADEEEQAVADVALVEAVSNYDHNRNYSSKYKKHQTEIYKILTYKTHENLRVAVANLLAAEAAS